MNISALTGALDCERVKHQALASRGQDLEITSTVLTLQEDPSRLVELQCNACRAMLGLSVDVEEILTQVNPRHDRFEAAVHAQPAATGLIQIETEPPKLPKTCSEK